MIVCVFIFLNDNTTFFIIQFILKPNIFPSTYLGCNIDMIKMYYNNDKDTNKNVEQVILLLISYMSI